MAAPTIVSGYPISVDRAAVTSGGATTSFTITLTASGGTPLVAGQPILLLLGADGPTSGTAQTFSTPTSANLTWNLVARSNAFSSGVQGGTAEVWKAVPGSNLTANEAVTLAATQGIDGFPTHTCSASATAVAFSGASTTTPSNTANSATSATPQVTVTGTAVDSLVYGVVLDWSQGSTAVQGSDTSDHAYSPAGSITNVAEHETNPSAGGSITVGLSTARAGWNFVGVEIVAGGETDVLGFSDSYDVQRFWQAQTWFQQNSFQSNAFSILGGTTGTAGPSGSHTDTIGLSDPQVATKSATATQIDTLGFSDPQAAAKGVRDSHTDTLGFSESQDAAVRKASSETDTLGMSDVQSSAQTQLSSETDTLGFSDPQAAAKGATATQVDTLGFSDPQQAAQGQAGSQTDTLGFSDAQASAVSGGGTFSGAHVDTLGFSDVQAAAAGKFSQQTDTLGFADGQDAVIGRAVTLADALGMADAYAAAVSTPSFSGSENDVLGLSDSYAAANSAIQGTSNEALGLADRYAAAVSGAVVFQQRFHVWNGSTWV